MWVYDRQTHAFLDVNDAALDKYGYARQEFLSMKMEDIRSAEDIPRFREYIDTVSATVYKVTRWNHRKKDGTVLDMDYRVRIIGGIFAVDPGAAGGTVVTCRFPNTSVQQPAD